MEHKVCISQETIFELSPLRSYTFKQSNLFDLLSYDAKSEPSRNHSGKALSAILQRYNILNIFNADLNLLFRSYILNRVTKLKLIMQAFNMNNTPVN